jgi:predicted permease
MALIHRLRTACRALRRDRRFTASIVLTLGFALGVAAAIYAVVEVVLLRSIPFDPADRLAVVLEHTKSGAGKAVVTNARTFLDWRERQTAFERIAGALAGPPRHRLIDGERPAVCQEVTWEFFDAVGVRPALGRAFSLGDEVDSHRVAILSDRFWRNRFGASRHVIGHQVVIDNLSWTIVGVAPPSFVYPIGGLRDADVFRLYLFQDDDRSHEESAEGRSASFVVIGRLKSSLSVAEADTHMRAIEAGIKQDYPAWFPARRVRVVPLRDHVVGHVKTWMQLVLAGLACVLALAALNAACLGIARGVRVAGELNLKRALGAPSSLLVRDWAAEVIVLSVLVTGLAVGVAAWGTHAFAVWLPRDVPRMAPVSFEWTRACQVAAAALVLCAIGGASILVETLRGRSALDFGETAQTMSPGGNRRIWSALLVVEVALAFVLVWGAHVFTASFAAVLDVPMGMDSHNVLTADLAQPDDAAHVLTKDAGERARLAEAAKRRGSEGGALLERVVDAVRLVPGVVAVGAVQNGLPMTSGSAAVVAAIPGHPTAPAEERRLGFRLISPGYLTALQVRLLHGRLLSDADNRLASQPVVVINSSAARQFWGVANPLGRVIQCAGKDWTVIGVIADLRQNGPEKPPDAEGFFPATQVSLSGEPTLVVRTAYAPSGLVPALEDAVRSAHTPFRVAGDWTTLDDYVGRLIGRRRFLAALFGAFGIFGGLLASAGVYSVVAYAIAARQREIAIRVSLGATPSGIVALLVRHVLLLVGFSCGLGAWVSVQLSTLVSGFVFQVRPGGGGALLLAGVVLVMSALPPALLPARRAGWAPPIWRLFRV